MKKLILLTILTGFGTQSCNFGITGSWKDEDIEQGLKNEINALDKKVFEAVSSKNVELLKSVMSDELIEKSKNNVDQLIEQVSGLVENKDYTVLNQYHAKNSTSGNQNPIVSGFSGQNDYIIHYQAPNKEIFISLLTIKNKLNDFIITNIYGKYPEGWKLNFFHIGQYKINGQTAPELFSNAKREYESGYLMDAANNMFLSSKVAKPIDKLWQYQKEDEINAFFEKVMTEINTKFKFPMVLDEVDTKPQILTIYPLGTAEGYFPMVEYLTKIDLKDTVKTKAEYQKIHSEIVKDFIGIDKGKDYIFYKAFSEMPNGKMPVPTYGFVKKLK